VYWQEDPCARDRGTEIAYPIHITIILAPRSKTFRQLHADKDARFPSYVTQELDGPVHFARDIDFVPDGEVEGIISLRGC